MVPCMLLDHGSVITALDHPVSGQWVWEEITELEASWDQRTAEAQHDKTHRTQGQSSLLGLTAHTLRGPGEEFAAGNAHIRDLRMTNHSLRVIQSPGKATVSRSEVNRKQRQRQSRTQWQWDSATKDQWTRELALWKDQWDWQRLWQSTQKRKKSTSVQAETKSWHCDQCCWNPEGYKDCFKSLHSRHSADLRGMEKCPDTCELPKLTNKHMKSLNSVIIKMKLRQ